MIKYDYTVTVTGNTAKLDKDIYLFRGNKNVHYYFAIKNASFNFKGTTDLIEKTNAINAAVTVVKPNAVEVANAIAPVENGKIHLKVTEDLIDEEVEVGDFDLVFDLFDDTDGAVTIPKVIGQFHVLERPCTTPISELVATNTTNEVDQALTDYAIVTYAEPVASTNADGTFAKKTWVPKEKITTAELNRIEEGIFKNSSQIKDIANNQPTDLSLDSATNLLQLVNSKGSKLGNGITLPISSGGGTSQYLHIKYSTTGAPQLAGQISDTPNAYIGLCVDANADAPINPHSYTWYKWKGEAGAKGDTGATPSLQIGTVETLESGSSATASITGTTENPLLNLGIPRGEGGTGGSEKEWKLLKDLTLTETVSAITEIFDNDYKEILIIAKGKAGGTSNCGMAITSYSENQASGVDLVLSSILWQVNEECTFSIYLCAENPVLFLIWKRCNSSILSSSEGTYNSANWNDKKGINKLLFRYGTFAEGNNYKIYGR
nr:MAG TPA: hypothetical protein [Caudoviricetes sp.]